MRIAHVETYHLKCPLTEPFGFSQWRYFDRQQMLLRVCTDVGIEGWGECYGPAAVSQAAVSSYYGPLLLGKDPLSVEAIWDDLWRRSLDYARRGMMLSALSGIDMALWDLRGRALGRSASDLMGGARCERVPCYATGMYFRDLPDEPLVATLVDEATGYHTAGYAAIKLKIGKNPGFDGALIRTVRRALPEVTLMADANHAYDLPEAVGIARILADAGFAWFEEPLSPEHPQQYRQLADAAPVPLAAGECEQTRWGFQSLLASGGVAVAQPDLAYCGGPSEALKIRAVASSLGVNVVPHAWGTQLGLAAALHFLASDAPQPGRAERRAAMLERDCTENPLRDEIFRVSLDIEGGVARVPSLPGLGVEVDVPRLERFCVRREEVTPDG
jgi:D-galactarolactone cycloisomerase